MKMPIAIWIGVTIAVLLVVFFIFEGHSVGRSILNGVAGGIIFGVLVYFIFRKDSPNEKLSDSQTWKATKRAQSRTLDCPDCHGAGEYRDAQGTYIGRCDHRKLRNRNNISQTPNENFGYQSKQKRSQPGLPACPDCRGTGEYRQGAYIRRCDHRRLRNRNSTSQIPKNSRSEFGATWWSEPQLIQIYEASDNGRCQINDGCNNRKHEKGGRNTTWNVDHLIPQKDDGLNELHNLVVACISCNQKKGSKLERKFIRLANRRRKQGIMFK